MTNSYHAPKLIKDTQGRVVGVNDLKANSRVKFWHIRHKKYVSMTVAHFNLVYREVECE